MTGRENEILRRVGELESKVAKLEALASTKEGYSFTPSKEGASISYHILPEVPPAERQLIAYQAELDAERTQAFERAALVAQLSDSPSHAAVAIRALKHD